MGVMGGSISGVPVLISDGALPGDVIVVDASGLVGGRSDVVLSEYNEGLAQISDAPDSPPTGATVLTSLWQENLSALVAERYFICSKVRSDAVAAFSGGYGSGFSPASLG
jgi:hypothetical protein